MAHILDHLQLPTATLITTIHTEEQVQLVAVLLMAILEGTHWHSMKLLQLPINREPADSALAHCVVMLLMIRKLDHSSFLKKATILRALALQLTTARDHKLMDNSHSSFQQHHLKKELLVTATCCRQLQILASPNLLNAVAVAVVTEVATIENPHTTERHRVILKVLIKTGDNKTSI